MAIEKDELIAKIKEVLKPELTQISYETWILPLGIRSIDGNHIIFTTTSEYQQDFIENKYRSLIFNTLRFIFITYSSERRYQDLNTSRLKKSNL